MSFRYYERAWGESRGDAFDEWGPSVWYFEIDGSGYPVRQIERYENGRVLKYDAEHVEDEYGALGEKPIDREEFAPFEVTKEAFEKAWSVERQ